MKKYILAILLCLIPGVVLYASEAMYLNENESALISVIGGQINEDNTILFFYDNFSTPFISEDIEEKRTVVKVYVNKNPIYYTLKYVEDFQIEFFENLNLPSQPQYYPSDQSGKALSVQYANLKNTEYGYIMGEAVALEYTDGSISFHINWPNRVKGANKTFPEVFVTKEKLKNYFTEMSVLDAKERLKSSQYDELAFKENTLITVSFILFLVALLYIAISFRKEFVKAFIFYVILSSEILLVLLIHTELKKTLTVPIFSYGFPLFIAVIISTALYIGKYKVEESEEMFP